MYCKAWECRLVSGEVHRISQDHLDAIFCKAWKQVDVNAPASGGEEVLPASKADMLQIVTKVKEYLADPRTLPSILGEGIVQYVFQPTFPWSGEKDMQMSLEFRCPEWIGRSLASR